MSYADAINLLDERRAGRDLPPEIVQAALELTGDIEPKPTIREILQELRRLT